MDRGSTHVYVLAVPCALWRDARHHEECPTPLHACAFPHESSPTCPRVRKRERTQQALAFHHVSRAGGAGAAQRGRPTRAREQGPPRTRDTSWYPAITVPDSIVNLLYIEGGRHH